MVWHSRAYIAEALERRHLLASVTLITHGFQLDTLYPTWVDAAAQAVREEIALKRGSSTDEVPWYHVEIFDVDLGSANPESTISLKAGKGLASSSTADAVVTVDWSDLSSLGGIWTQPVASVLATAFDRAFSGIGIVAPLAQLPLHLIGHSRGASVISELAKHLGEAGVWVDQATFLDSHPLNPVEGLGAPDAPVRTYENIIFADNYWRQDGLSLDFDGQSVFGTHETYLDFGNYAENTSDLVPPLDVDPFDPGYGQEHSDVHLWYHGTIDTVDPSSDGGRTVPPNWYSGDMGPRQGTGYYYSGIRGGQRSLDGLGTRFGGTASRSSVTRGGTGTQWPNIDALSLRHHPTGAVSRDERLFVSYRYQDQDGSAAVTFFADTDFNPSNAGAIQLETTQALPGTGSSVERGLYHASVAGVPAGSWKLYARINDADGHTRYSYLPQPITVTSAPARARG